MTNSDKRDYIRTRVQYWRSKLMLDPKVHVFCYFPSSTPVEMAEDDHPVCELIKQEELLVSTLERIFIGERDFAEALRVSGWHDERAPHGALASCDLSNGEYWLFTIEFYDRLMEHDGDDFRVLADSAVCHEVLHIFLWPLLSYAEHLQGEK